MNTNVIEIELSLEDYNKVRNADEFDIERSMLQTSAAQYTRISLQPKRSKREDFMDLDIKVLEKALKNAHREGTWDQDQYDQMYELVQKYKDAVL